VSWPIRNAGGQPERKAVTRFVREARSREESRPKTDMLFAPTTIARKAIVVVRGDMP
jgi:hypothetical protein